MVKTDILRGPILSADDKNIDTKTGSCREGALQKCADNIIRDARGAADGTTTFFHQDKRGSVIAMSDTSGAVAEGPYTYDSFGGGAATSGAAYKYTGRWLVPETGLYCSRARYYAPALVRAMATVFKKSVSGITK